MNIVITTFDPSAFHDSGGGSFVPSKLGTPSFRSADYHLSFPELCCNSAPVFAGAVMLSTMSMAVLEPTVPLWVMRTMHVEKWQLG